MKEKKPPMMKQKLKQCRKMNPSSHKKSVNSSYVWSKNREKRKKTTYEEESETVFPAELKYHLTKVFYGLKVTSKQS